MIKHLFILWLLSFSIIVMADRPEYILELKDHLFEPAVLEIPANKKIKLVIYNHDQTPEEFDSFDLNREKVIFPHKKAIVFIGPLAAGRYEFFGEFNPNTAQGVVIVIDETTPNNKKNQLTEQGDNRAH